MKKEVYEKAKEIQKRLKVREEILKELKKEGLLNCYIDKNVSSELYEDMLCLWEKHIELLEKEFDEL